MEAWLEKAIATHRIHIANIKNQGKEWTIEKTAKALGRSKSSIYDDIMISKWYKTHSTRLERFSTARDALEFIRDKKEEMEMDA